MAQIPASFRPWAEASGLTSKNVLDVIATADRTEVFEYDGLVVQGFAKRVTRTRRPTFVLAITSQLPGKESELTAVLKVYDGFCHEVGSLPPFALLERIVDKFGLEIALGDTRKRLYLRETVSVKGPVNALAALTPGVSRNMLALSLMRFVREESSYRCGMLFAIGLDQYQAYQGGQGLASN